MKRYFKPDLGRRAREFDNTLELQKAKDHVFWFNLVPQLNIRA